MGATSRYLCGEIVQVNEVLENQALQQDRSVRLTGSIVMYDAARNLAEIEFNGHKIFIDTSLLGKFDFQLRHLFQFIGETYRQDGMVYLRARIARNVNGLDVKLFQEALTLRREFLATTMAA